MLRIAALDLRLLRPAAGIWGVLLVLVTAALCAGLENWGVTMLTAMPVMVAMTLFGSIEASKLTQMYGMLPVRRAEVMCGHYLVLLAVAALTYLPWLGAVLAHAVRPSWGVVPGELLGWTAALGGLLLSLALMLPIVVKWGSNKALLVFGLVVFVIFALATAILKELAWPSGELTGAWPLLVLAVGMLAYLGSMVLATRAYERQDH